MTWAVVFIILFFLAHLFKFVRFYLVLMEQRSLTLRQAVFLYTRTTFANLIIPFKCGEFYRIAAVCHMTGKIQVAFLSVIIDRYFDTLALMLLMILFMAASSVSVGIGAVIMAVFLAVGFLAFHSYTRTAKYINRYFIMHKRSDRSIQVLRTLDVMDSWFAYAKTLVEGRSALLFLSSLGGWIFEFLALAVFSRYRGLDFSMGEFNSYIGSIFGEGSSLLSKPYNKSALAAVGAAMVLSGAYCLIADSLKKGRKAKARK